MRRVRATWLCKTEPKDFSQNQPRPSEKGGWFSFVLKDHPAELEKSLDTGSAGASPARCGRAKCFEKPFAPKVGSRFALIAASSPALPVLGNIF